MSIIKGPVHIEFMFQWGAKSNATAENRPCVKKSVIGKRRAIQKNKLETGGITCY